MKRLSFVALLILTLNLSGDLIRAQSPFHRSPIKEVSIELGWKGRIMQQINKTQKELRLKLTILVKDLKRNGISPAVLLLFGFSFLYGIVHACGPGHGKVIVMSCMLSEQKKTILKGISMGSIVAFGEAVSAIIIVYGIYFLTLGRISTGFQNAENLIRTIGYVAILVIGTCLFFFRCKKHLFRYRQWTKNINQNESTQTSSFWIAASLGIIPCPGVMILLIFTLTMKMYLLGIMLALIMALGMSITISLFGLAVALPKTSLIQSISSQSRRMWIIEAILELLSALLMVILALYLLS